MRNDSFENIAKVLKKGKSCLIFTHIVMDGDAIGSAAALCLAMQKEGIDAYVVTEDKLAKTSAITLVVQVNGKVKDKIEVDAESTKEELEKHALESEKVKQAMDGKTVVKTIVVPGRLVNIVVK